MGLASLNGSLLHKLNQLKAHEVPFEEYVSFITKEQERRTISRALFRANKIATETNTVSRGRPPKKKTLADYGFEPNVIQQLLSKTNQTEEKIINELKKKGII